METISMLKEYLEIREVESYTTLKKSAIYAQMKIAGFPLPHQLEGIRKNIWRRSEIEAWMEKKLSK